MNGKQRKSKASLTGRQRRVAATPHTATMEMFRQAVGFHSGGQLAMADHLYRQVLELDPHHADALHWLGVLEGQNGNLASAIELLERSVGSNPDDPVALNDLGTAQRALNRREQALASYARALALKPDYTKALCDRGAVLHELMRLEEARASLEQALALAPTDVEAQLRTCRVLADMGDLGAALTRSVQALALEDSDRTHNGFAEVLRATRFSGQAANLQPHVVRAISEPWGRPNDLGPAAVSFLRQNQALMRCVERAAVADSQAITIQALFDGDGAAACADPVLLALLMNVLIADRALERFLTAARRGCLHEFGDGRSSAPALLAFQCALAQQCFINEYVFAAADDEADSVGRLRQQVADALASGEAPEAMSVAIAASYRPLTELPAAEKLLDHVWPECVSRVLTQQLREPAEETQIKHQITALTSVSDPVSRQVRQQYEESPYPRWVKYPLKVTATSVDNYLGGRFPHAAFERLGKSNADTAILVAGCGTGQHSIEAALLFRGARLLAIDLSRSSLAYALRKTRELKIPAIEYAQADILGMAGVGRKFDVIESMGVLHHLADPVQGWKSLLTLLSPGGFMRIGLYSERARQPVVAIRKVIAEHGYAPNVAGIRACRQALLAETGLREIDSILDSVDFYSTSAVRDLLFHVQEHRFTLSLIKQLIGTLGLDFVGFETDPAVLRQYAARNPGDLAMNKLDLWDAFEADNPLTFSGMYQFWVQKPR